jgi:dihydropteroate synthase
VGIVNVTPDSFYDGGQAADVDAAVAKGLALIDEGADIIDIGGESTRPFSEPVSAETELARVLPVVRGILAVRPDAVLSVDTTKASVARACLDAGALILNDVSAMEVDPEILQVVGDFHPGYVLMHSLGRPRSMQIEPRYDDVMAEIMRFFAAKLEILVRSGVPESRIVLDPGIGFGKTVEHNLEILKNICKLFEFGRPVYMALSNKSLWGGLLGRQGRERNAATLAATVALYGKGVLIHRVHEAREIRDGLTVAHLLGKGTSGEQGC